MPADPRSGVVRLSKWARGLFSGDRAEEDRLFDGDDTEFKRFVGQATIYGEYGCGASTVWVSANCDCDILCVDSSAEWIDSVRTRCVNPERLQAIQVDLGALGPWGRPRGYERSDNFELYRTWLWEQGTPPDVVLVDGRFRVACFLTSLIKAVEGTVMIFDDYIDRHHYHVVERFLSPFQHCGRQAFFRVQAMTMRDRKEVMEMISKFEYVMD